MSLWIKASTPPQVEPTRAAVRASSIAVLPFANASPDPSDDYLGYGLASELARGLHQLPELRIAPRSSSLASASRQLDPLFVGRRLDAGTVLLGSVRRSEDRLRVTARLVDVDEGFDLWSETYDRMFGDLPAVGDEIKRAVTATLRIHLPPDSSPGGSYRGSVEAFDAYLAGLYWMDREVPGHLDEAVAQLGRAVELDSSFAPAHAALAEAYLIDPIGAERPLALTTPLAVRAATTALELDSNLAGPHVTLGRIRFEYDRSWGRAEAEFRRAIALEPDLPEAYQAYSRFLLSMGRTSESLQASEKAQQLSPLAPRFLEHLGWHYLHARQYQPARDALVRAIQLDSTRWRPRAFLALLEQSVGNNVEALAALGPSLHARPWRTDLQVALGQLYALSGRGEEARAILRNLLDPPSKGPMPWYLIACLQATLGQRTGAFASLDRAVRERSPLVLYLRIDPRVDTLRTDRRFVRLLRQMRLP